MLFGLKVPVPPLQVPVVAPPVIVPAKLTFGLLAHTVWSADALVTTAALIVMVIASLVVPHGPAGSALVDVNVTVPAAISAALGV